VNAEPKRRSLITWLITCAITLAYLALDRSADGRGAYRASTIVTTVAILLALVKARLVFREFMQVRSAPTALRRITDLWVLLMGAALLGSYLAGLAAR
jgi:hypothetical protein